MTILFRKLKFIVSDLAFIILPPQQPNKVKCLNLQPTLKLKYLPAMLSIKSLVDTMRSSSSIATNRLLTDKSLSLVEKCVLMRQYFGPQSTISEKILKTDLEMGDAPDEHSGDASKDGLNYEIKASLHANNSKFNFVQIRPDHTVDYYVFLGYDLFHQDEAGLGKSYLFKIPSNDVYELIVEFGGYAHGTVKKLGKITRENLKGRGCEYALRVSPQCKGKKNTALWQRLLSYEVAYDPSNF